ncbi:MAG: hypothetical protein HY738_11390 [Bacteroidia bacterium]|nr:hypothetical protein [Bacteroidia bacterium]
MQPYKIINKNSDLEIISSNSEKIISSLTDVMNKFNIKNNFMIFDFLKCKGLAISSLLSILIILPFYGIANICQLMRCGIKRLDIEGQKDVFYDVKNNEFIDRRKLLLLHVKRFMYLISNNKNLKSLKTTALIFDDTLLEKTGKKIEKISYVNDHVSHRTILGYKLLVCGFWDGESFIPVDFSLHREKGTKHEKYIKDYHIAAKNVEKQRYTVSKIQKTFEKDKQKFTENLEKYNNKPNKTNKLSYEKAELKYKNSEKQLSESKKFLLKYESEKTQAYNDLKRYYSKGYLFGLTTQERQEQFKKAVSTKSHGFKRRKEADNDKISIMLEMLCRVVKYGFRVGQKCYYSSFKNGTTINCNPSRCLLLV